MVRVTASEMIGTEVLPPAFAAFREAHPNIVVELVLSNRSEDLLRREADIAVRMVRPTQSLHAGAADSDVGQYAALRAGFGIGACQVALAKRDCAASPCQPLAQQRG